MMHIYLTSRAPALVWPSKPEAQPLAFQHQVFAVHLQEEEEDEEEASRSGAAWCFTAVMAFMAMLLIRHLFELFDTEHKVQPAAHDQPEGGLGPQLQLACCCSG